MTLQALINDLSQYTKQYGEYTKVGRIYKPKYNSPVLEPISFCPQIVGITLDNDNFYEKGSLDSITCTPIDVGCSPVSAFESIVEKLNNENKSPLFSYEISLVLR